jgi:hypothetical protein
MIRFETPSGQHCVHSRECGSGSLVDYAQDSSYLSAARIPSREQGRCALHYRRNSVIYIGRRQEDNEKYQVACMHPDLKSLIAKILAVNCNTRAPKIALQTPKSESASFSVDCTQNDSIRSK